MSEEEQRRQDAIHAVAVHVILGFLLIPIYIWIVPTFSGLLKDFNAKLPTLTQWVIQASDIIRSPAGLLFLLLVVPGYTWLDWKIYLWIHRRHGKPWATIYSVMVVLAVASFILFTHVAMTLPFHKLHVW